MTRKRETEEPEGGSGCGAVLALGLVLAVTGVLYRVTPTGFVLGFWAFGAALLWWKIHIPSPPPPEDPPSNAKPQFTIVEDRPGHHAVVWERGPGVDTEDER